MKHKIHFIKNGHISYDILDDFDNLIVGGVSQPYSGTTETAGAYIIERVYPNIEAMLNPPVIETKTIEASPILQAMEETKESIKFDLIEYIKSNPEVTLTDFLSYCENKFGWQEAGFAMKMIYEYVNAAERHEMLSLMDTSKEYYFDILKMIIIKNSLEALHEMLQ